MKLPNFLIVFFASINKFFISVKNFFKRNTFVVNPTIIQPAVTTDIFGLGIENVERLSQQMADSLEMKLQVAKMTADMAIMKQLFLNLDSRVGKMDKDPFINVDNIPHGKFPDIDPDFSDLRNGVNYFEDPTTPKQQEALNKKHVAKKSKTQSNKRKVK